MFWRRFGENWFALTWGPSFLHETLHKKRFQVAKLSSLLLGIVRCKAAQTWVIELLMTVALFSGHVFDFSIVDFLGAFCSPQWKCATSPHLDRPSNFLELLCTWNIPKDWCFALLTNHPKNILDSSYHAASKPKPTTTATWPRHCWTILARIAPVDWRFRMVSLLITWQGVGIRQHILTMCKRDQVMMSQFGHSPPNLVWKVKGQE